VRFVPRDAPASLQASANRSLANAVNRSQSNATVNSEEHLETSRDDHKAKMEAQLKEWTARLGVLQAKAEKASAETKIKLQAEIEELKKLELSGREHIASLASKTWDEVKTEATEQWNKVAGAFDAIWARVSA
jgi:hypothetical protein